MPNQARKAERHDKLRQFPGDVTTNNWPRLTANFGANHIFNNAAASTDGYHTIAKWSNQAGAQVAITGVGQLYTRTITGPNTKATEQLAYIPGTNPVAGDFPEVILTVMPVRACVFFNGAGAATSSYVATVAPISTGIYQVTVPGLPSTMKIYPQALVYATGGLCTVNVNVAPAFSAGNWVFRLAVQRSGSAFNPDGVFCLVYGG